MLTVAPLATALGLLGGITLGLLTGYYRGWVDDVFSRLVDALLAFPLIILAVLVLASLGRSPRNVILVIGIIFTPLIARTVRSAVLIEREREYVAAAQLRGERGPRIMVFEILPNITGPITVEGTIRLGYAIFAAATLAFLGLGIQDPSPDWGLQVANARAYVQIAWWMAIFPAPGAVDAGRGRQPDCRRHPAGARGMSAVAEQAAVRIEGLTVSYRRRRKLLRVLNDVSFEIGHGEAYGLVGESGCGKTTAAMALMRYLPDNAVVDGGRIMFGDEDVLTASDSTLRKWRGERMAMVYQDPGSALNPSIKVGEQIAEVYRFHKHLGKSDALAAAIEMLSTVQISAPDRVARRYPHELSGGQQQRVMFAMALATDPDLLVLDEPTTGLDATVEAEVLDLVEQLRAQFNTSILFVSHNLGIVARVCERVGVLYAGRLIEQGPAQELFQSPRHPYTLALLRCMPRLGMRKDIDRLDSIAGSLPPLGAEIAGCVYADRCPIARDRCRTEPPQIEPVNERHGARCFYHGGGAGYPAAGAGDRAGAGRGRRAGACCSRCRSWSRPTARGERGAGRRRRRRARRPW